MLFEAKSALAIRFSLFVKPALPYARIVFFFILYFTLKSKLKNNISWHICPIIQFLRYVLAFSYQCTAFY